MSLVGRLEDVNLVDVLQIVNSSRKSGTLTLQQGSCQGIVGFYQGRIIWARSSDQHEGLGHLLLNEGIIDGRMLQQGLAYQREHPQQRLGDIFARLFDISRERIETVARAQLKALIVGFMGWSQGQFSFALEPPSEEDVASDGVPMPQGLAIAEVLAAAREARPKALAPPAAKTNNRVLVRDDDSQVLEAVAASLRQIGWEAVCCYTDAQLMQQMAGQVPAAVLLDLIMPQEDGQGVLGGLQLTVHIRQQYFEVPIVLMTDHPQARAEQRSRELGVLAVLPKPRRSQLAAAAGKRQLQVLAQTVQDLIQPATAASQEGQRYNLGEELLGIPAYLRSGETSPGLGLLRSMQLELHRTVALEDLPLLLLRFGGELMERCVFFWLSGADFVGAGQSGLPQPDADARIRRLRLAQSDPSVLGEVVSSGLPFRGKAPNMPGNRCLWQALGSEVPQDVFVGPLCRRDEVVGLLYGDNALSQDEVGDTLTLEIFMSQAGFALEKQYLERQLQRLQGGSLDKT